MDKRKSVLNVTVSILFRVIMIICSILVRRFLIQYIGNEVNGLDSLYASLIGFLSVAELGVGSAITFCMYKPIVEQDHSKVAALYQLFLKAYKVIGIIMFAIGIIIIPFLPYMAKDYVELNENLGLTFFVMLVSIVLSYAFSAKTSIINAYKNNYITTAISSIGMIVQYILQIVVIACFRSFMLYLVCRILAMLLQWVLTEIYANKHYGVILHHRNELVDLDTKKKILEKVKALFMHRIGGILVNSADSVIISTFIGVVALGKYTNYSTIVISMSSVIALFFSPLTSIVGHAFVSEKNKLEQYYQKFYFLNFGLGMVFFLGYYAVIDNLVCLLFGENLELTKEVSFVITINYFVQFMRQSTLLFRDATGTFYNDRWKPVFEGSVNTILSILFVKTFHFYGGDEMGIIGVIVATIITNLTICHIVEPYVLYKYAFGLSVKKQLFKNYLCISIFVLALFLLNGLMQTKENQVVEFLINGAISVCISIVMILMVFLLYIFAYKMNKNICGRAAEHD